ncbi:MAG: hypothetical protein K0R00_3149 [Herbinix sp.]|jgi:3-dehydroquinate synthase|nr:hypothetical protein [Herbinix sp.]
MNNQIIVNYENKPAYEILLKPDFSDLSQALLAMGLEGRKLMIISDSNVARYHLNEVAELVREVSALTHTFVFPAGEANKNLDTVNLCYEELIKSSFDRNDILIALGGGVVGDLTGFVAATYLRGIRFIQVPTTLLSMVDSSIGGKTGVDYKAYKNMVGAFHQPKLVYMNIASLNTLSEAEYFSGMGEIIKHGLIKDSRYYAWIKANYDGIVKKDLSTLQDLIYHSCQIKRQVVENDPKEKGERALLNFGHTIGHSVEKLMNFKLLHGECVCLGMAAAAYLSYKRTYLTQTEYQDILECISLFFQPIKVEGLVAEQVYEVTKLDKKMDSTKIRFILLQGIGNSIIDTSVTKEEMLEAIGEILL